MRINGNMFVINDEQGMIINYLSLNDDGIDMFGIGISHTSLKILEKKFRSNTFSWENNDRTLEMHGANELMRLYFKTINNSEKHKLNLNAEDTLKLKTILCSSN